MYIIYIYFTDEEDFNTTVFEVVFPADELIDPVGSVDAFISVVDDDINENSEQLFVVVVEAAGAINSRLLSITRNLTICRLMDNDRKFACYIRLRLLIFVLLWTQWFKDFFEMFRGLTYIFVIVDLCVLVGDMLQFHAICQFQVCPNTSHFIVPCYYIRCTCIMILGCTNLT